MVFYSNYDSDYIRAASHELSNLLVFLFSRNYSKLKSKVFCFAADNVLVVIGGDKKYANSDEKQNKFISQSAFNTIKTQFQTKFIDGRQSFIFSWDDSHRPIHEEALLHYFDRSRRGQKFEHQQRGQPTDNVAEVS